MKCLKIDTQFSFLKQSIVINIVSFVKDENQTSIIFSTFHFLIHQFQQPNHIYVFLEDSKNNFYYGLQSTKHKNPKFSKKKRISCKIFGLVTNSNLFTSKIQNWLQLAY
jgi:hypothetical protein